MLDLFEKSFLLGLGALSLTKNAAEKFVKDAVGGSQMTPEEGNAFLKTFLEEGEKAKTNLTQTVEEILKTRGQSLLPCSKRIAELEAKIAELEERIAKLETK